MRDSRHCSTAVKYFATALKYFVAKLVKSFGILGDAAESLDDFRYKKQAGLFAENNTETEIFSNR